MVTSHNIAVLVAWVGMGLPPASEPAPMPQCGIASIYAMLKLHELPASLDGIAQRVRENRPKADLRRLTMRDLRETLESYGLYAHSVRIDPSGISQVATPAILYFPSDRIGRNNHVGHYAVLDRVVGNDVEITDLTGSGHMSLSIMDLCDIWAGDLLVVSKEPIEFSGSRGTQWLLYGAIALCLVGGIVVSWKDLTSSRRRRLFRGLNIILMGATCVATFGCANATIEENKGPTVRFDEPSVDLGVIRGGERIKQAFTFTVWEHGPINQSRGWCEVCRTSAVAGTTGVSPWGFI